MDLASLVLACPLYAFAHNIPAAQYQGSSVHLPISKRFSQSGFKNVLASDLERIAALRARAIPFGKVRRAVVPITNTATSYTVNVTVGTDQDPFQLLVDTGSSNTWVGASGRKPISTTTVCPEVFGIPADPVSVSYGPQGSVGFMGDECTDSISLDPGNVTVKNQSFAIATTSNGVDGVDGILGIGPQQLSEGTLSDDESATIPTVADNLFAEGSIPADLFSIAFAPINSEPVQNGELIFGEIDPNQYTGVITYTPITSTSPASMFWGINQTVTYGTQGVSILPSTAGIVDTGTSLLLLASDAFAQYQAATGATPDRGTGLLSLTPARFASLQSLFFIIAGTTFELTANAQIWPRTLNSNIGGTPQGIYLVISDLGTPSGQGFDFVNGLVFLERFYSVYDIGNQQVGIATTEHTFDETN